MVEVRLLLLEAFKRNILHAGEILLTFMSSIFCEPFLNKPTHAPLKSPTLFDTGCLCCAVRSISLLISISLLVHNLIYIP